MFPLDIAEKTRTSAQTIHGSEILKMVTEHYINTQRTRDGDGKVLTLFYAALWASILLCSLVAGLLLGFAIVVMPGIATLSDKEFLSAFKVMDATIQNRQPIFMLVWVGSIVSVVLMLCLGTSQLNGRPLHMMWLASGLYLVAVQAPTIRFNIPLNNAVQALTLESMSVTELAAARSQFEGSWNRWNRLRTCAGIASVSILLSLQILSC